MFVRGFGIQKRWLRPPHSKTKKAGLSPGFFASSRDRLLRGVLALFQSRLRALGESGEGGGVADGEIRQDLAVQRVADGLEAGDELRVGQPVQARGGVDA